MYDQIPDAELKEITERLQPIPMDQWLIRWRGDYRSLAALIEQMKRDNDWLTEADKSERPGFMIGRENLFVEVTSQCDFRDSVPYGQYSPKGSKAHFELEYRLDIFPSPDTSGVTPLMFGCENHESVNDTTVGFKTPISTLYETIRRRFRLRMEEEAYAARNPLTHESIMAMLKSMRK